MLRPKILATGHGKSFYGTRGLQCLDRLARQFHALAVPKHGRYVNEPALADDEGVYYIPKNGPREKKVYALTGLVALGIIALALTGVIWNKRRKR